MAQPKKTEEQKNVDVKAQEQKEAAAKETVKTRKKILYAIDSADRVEDIIKDAKRADVTVLVKSKYSNAPVDELLKMADITLITAFYAQFSDSDFDKGIVEKEMVTYLPEKLVEKLKAAK